MAQGRGQSGGRKEPTFDSAPEVRVGAAGRNAPGGANKPSPRKPKSKGRNKRGARRSLIGRMTYWSLVTGLWIVIGGVGTVAYVGAHLPPIQSLEIPKRPPSIQIVDMDGHKIDKLLVVRPPQPLWATEQALRSAACDAITSVISSSDPPWYAMNPN